MSRAGKGDKLSYFICGWRAGGWGEGALRWKGGGLGEKEGVIMALGKGGAKGTIPTADKGTLPTASILPYPELGKSSSAALGGKSETQN